MRINHHTAVVAIIEKNGHIIIGKKTTKKHFLSNSWHIPGGKLQSNEDDISGLTREMKEELGIKIKVNKLLDQHFDSQTNTIVKWYLCSPITMNLAPGSDLSAIRLVPKNEVINTCD